MLRTSTRALFTRAPATTAAAFLVAMLRARDLLRSAAFRTGNVGGDKAGVLAFATTAVVFPRTTLPAVSEGFASLFPAAPAIAIVTPLPTAVFSFFPTGDAAAALRAARSELSTRRMAMPCLPLRTNFVRVAPDCVPSEERAAPREARRATATATRRAAVAAATAAAGPVSGDVGVIAVGSIKPRTRIKLLFLLLSLPVGSRRDEWPAVDAARPLQPQSARPAQRARRAAQREAGCAQRTAAGILAAHLKRSTAPGYENEPIPRPPK